jgi:hypothetical protein
MLLHDTIIPIDVLRGEAPALAWLDSFLRLPLDDALALESVRLRQRHGLKIPDAILLATAFTRAAPGLSTKPSPRRKPVDLSNSFRGRPLRRRASCNRNVRVLLRAPVSPPVGVMLISEPSAASSSTASGLALQNAANCLGVSPRQPVSVSGRRRELGRVSMGPAAGLDST